MFKIIKKRVQSHVLEKVIGGLMIVFGIAAVFVFIKAIGMGQMYPDTAMIEILLILVLAVLGQTIILIRIYEQHEN